MWSLRLAGVVARCSHWSHGCLISSWMDFLWMFSAPGVGACMRNNNKLNNNVEVRKSKSWEMWNKLNVPTSKSQQRTEGGTTPPLRENVKMTCGRRHLSCIFSGGLECVGHSFAYVAYFFIFEQCCGSMPFWCGSGSADPCLWIMDPDSDPAIFVIDLQDVKNFF